MTGTMATKYARCFILCLQLICVWDVLTEGYVNGKQVASAAGKSVLSKCFCVVRLVFVCISAVDTRLKASLW